jgi:hypothetical protein
MMDVVIRRYAAWATNPAEEAIDTDEAWSGWASAPTTLGADGKPPVAFLAPAVRRRASRLTRLMLEAAFACTDESERASVRTVFSSRHGAIHVAIKILASIAREESVSPLQFSHSVHNAQAGLFSIAAGNREASSSIAAGTDTFAHGFLEAVLHLERRPEQPVLLVTGDEPIPGNLAHLIEEPAAAYSTALLLARSDSAGAANAANGTVLRFSREASRAPRKPLDWPDAIEFIRFLHGDESELSLESGRGCWRWQRA